MWYLKELCECNLIDGTENEINNYTTTTTTHHSHDLQESPGHTLHHLLEIIGIWLKIVPLVLCPKQKVFVWGWWNFVHKSSQDTYQQRKKGRLLDQIARMLLSGNCCHSLEAATVAQRIFPKWGAEHTIIWCFGHDGLLKLNCLIVFVKRARAKLFKSFKNFKIAPLQTEI